MHFLQTERIFNATLTYLHPQLVMQLVEYALRFRAEWLSMFNREVLYYFFAFKRQAPSHLVYSLRPQLQAYIDTVPWCFSTSDNIHELCERNLSEATHVISSRKPCNAEHQHLRSMFLLLYQHCQHCVRIAKPHLFWLTFTRHLGWFHSLGAFSNLNALR